MDEIDGRGGVGDDDDNYVGGGDNGNNDGGDDCGENVNTSPVQMSLFPCAISVSSQRMFEPWAVMPLKA